MPVAAVDREATSRLAGRTACTLVDWHAYGGAFDRREVIPAGSTVIISRVLLVRLNRHRRYLVGVAGRPGLHAIYDDTQLSCWDDTVDAAA